MDLQSQLIIIHLLILQYNQTVQLPWMRESLHRKINNLFRLYLARKRALPLRRRVIAKRRCWVRPIFCVERRLQQGDSDNLITELRQEDEEKYFTYFHCLPNVFEQLLERVGPLIEKQHAIRDPISARTRLEITLRYLSSGDSMMSLSFAFRVAHNTISGIVAETCQAIYQSLKDDYFIQPSDENWKIISEDFTNIWNFDHCLGAVDGKQVEIQAPRNTGSLYFNYKHDFSINLMAISDAKARFIIVDVGAEGRRSDSGVLRSSVFTQMLQNNTLRIPPPEPLGEEGPTASYVFVGDEAFHGYENILSPYPRSGDLNNMKRVFNYRLSRARRIVECAFGTMTARWRIFRRKIIASVPTTKKIILACVALHNFMMHTEENAPANERPYQTLREVDRNLLTEGLRNIPVNAQNQNNPNQTRELFAQHFYHEGAVEWQWEKVLQNDF